MPLQRAEQPREREFTELGAGLPHILGCVLFLHESPLEENKRTKQQNWLFRAVLSLSTILVCRSAGTFHSQPGALIPASLNYFSTKGACVSQEEYFVCIHTLRARR